MISDYRYYNNDNYYSSGFNRGFAQRTKRSNNNKSSENQVFYFVQIFRAVNYIGMYPKETKFII